MSSLVASGQEEMDHGRIEIREMAGKRVWISPVPGEYRCRVGIWSLDVIRVDIRYSSGG